MFPHREEQDAEVLDLSASGMRLCLKRANRLTAGSMHEVSLVSSAGRIDLSVKLVWVRRKGFRRVEVGVTFGEPSDELRRALGQIMRAGADTYVVYDGAA